MALRLMIQDGQGRWTGPVNVSDKDKLTLVLEAGPGVHKPGAKTRGNVWRMEIDAEDWNGLPRIAAVRTEDCVEPMNLDLLVAGDEPTQEIDGVYMVVSAHSDGSDRLIFSGIDEPVYLPGGMQWPMPGLSYRVHIERDAEDGDLVLCRCGEGA